MIHPVRMWSHVSRSLKFWPISIGMEALRIGIQPDLALVSKKGIHSQHGGFCNFHQGVSEHGGKTPHGYRANDDSQMDFGVFPMFSPIFFKNLGFHLVFYHVFPCFPNCFPFFGAGPYPPGPSRPRHHAQRHEALGRRHGTPQKERRAAVLAPHLAEGAAAMGEIKLPEIWDRTNIARKGGIDMYIYISYIYYVIM